VKGARELVPVREEMTTDTIFDAASLTHTSCLKAGIPREPTWTGYKEGISRATSSISDAAPESFFRYSDINFILLGEIVQQQNC